MAIAVLFTDRDGNQSMIYPEENKANENEIG